MPLPLTGRFTPSLGTAVNENTVALAAFSFDFALYKVEAPHEFTGLQTTLSPLLGLSAWHLYPNITVHEKDIHKVEQNDHLIPKVELLPLA